MLDEHSEVMERYLSSSQAFVRALKASSDPPTQDGPSKLDIARAGWERREFVVSNKEELICDWLIGKMLKDRAQPVATNSLFESGCWSLLAHIISGSSNEQRWLRSVAGYFPLQHLVIAYLSLSPQIAPSSHNEVDTLFDTCLRAFWSMTASRLTTENLLECYGALLLSMHDEKRASSTAMQSIASTISMSYSLSSVSAANKRKLATTFLSSHFEAWARYIFSEDISASPAREVIYKAGIDTVYYADFIKQAADGKTDDIFRDALSSLSQSSLTLVVKAAPRLLQSFVEASSRSRTQPTSGLTARQPVDRSKQLRASVTHTFGVFDGLLTTTATTDESSIWASRTSMLEVLQKNSLLTVDDTDISTRLTTYATRALDTLEKGDSSEEGCTSVLENIVAIASADIDVVLSHLPRLLVVLSSISRRFDEHVQSILRTVIDYHCKTRSVPAYISQVLDAVSFVPISPPHDRYRSACASPLFASFHCDLTSKAVETYLTPSQVPELAAELIERLQAGASAMEEHAGSRDAKDDSAEGTAATQAASLALTTHFASIALAALPVDLMQRSSRDEVQQKWAEDIYGLLRSSLRHILKTLRRGASEYHWAWSVAGAAMIRLDYQLVTTPRVWPQYSLQNRSKAVEQLRKLYDLETLPPSLLVLVCRSLVVMHREDASNLLPVLDKAMLAVSTRLKADIAWSGLLNDCFERGSKVEAIALLQVLLDRCLYVFNNPDFSAATHKLAEIVLSYRLNASDYESKNITVPYLLLSACRRADFWEIAPLRDAILAAAEAKTSSLGDMDAEAMLGKWLSGQHTESPPRLGDAEGMMAVFDFLLLAPPEYLTRSFASNMAGRAFVLDLLLEYRRLKASGPPQWRNQLILRTFLLRGLTSTDSSTTSRHVSMYLMKPRNMTTPLSLELQDVTGSLLRAHFSVLLRQNDDQQEDLVPVMKQLKTELAKHDLYDFVAVSWLQAVSSLDTTHLTTPLLDDMRHLCETIQAMSARQMAILLERPEEVSSARKTIQLWQLTLQTLRALSSKSTVDVYGPRLILQLVDSNSPLFTRASDLQDVVFALLVEEWRLRDDPAPAFVRLLGAYLKLLSSAVISRVALEEVFCSVVKTLPPDLFQASMKMMGEMLRFRDGDFGSLANVATVAHQVLHNAPEGTTKISQDFFEKSLQVFVNDASTWMTHGPTRTSALELVSVYCADRPAVLRPADISSIFALLSQCCAHSHVHDVATSRPTFYYVVSIISSIIRLRRDLIMNALPHLGLLLRRLILCFRQQRPQLGAKQSRQVADSLPVWVSPTDSLGSDNAHTMSRLLESLATKTVVRTFAAPPPGSEAAAASLARPFSKHAASVIQAYVDAISDPLCTVSASVRKELRPGLFVLCGMLSEHSRDAMMASSLDTSGKIIMKTLWQEYEKQRYVGKG